MPLCCTNCRTKYSLLNREEGCSSCAMSFCKKCVGYRAIIPNLSDKPLTVCYDCYKKLEEKKIKEQKKNAIITSTPIPENSRLPQQQIQSTSKNWWGEGLPPPSFRSTYSAPVPPPKRAKPVPAVPVIEEDKDIQELENRRRELHKVPEPLSIEQIEQRLAELRGCDVEVIRNPRSYFQDSSRELPNATTPADLMKIAQDRARIEEKEEAYERREIEELEERRRQIFSDDEQGNPRESVAESEASEYSMATKEQMKEINDILEDAEKKMADTKRQENIDASELRQLMSTARQKSLDAMQWNEKISQEIGGFWDRQNDKLKVEEEEDDEKSLDEETFKKILHEAENCPDEPPPAEVKSSQEPSSSPKKRGFFNKFFKK